MILRCLIALTALMLVFGPSRTAQAPRAAIGVQQFAGEICAGRDAVRAPFKTPNIPCRQCDDCIFCSIGAAYGADALTGRFVDWAPPSPTTIISAIDAPHLKTQRLGAAHRARAPPA